MKIGFKNALGIHEQAYLLRSERSAVLANNIANADTPNFKARDTNFLSILRNIKNPENQPSLNLEKTKYQHMSGSSTIEDGLLFRHPHQPSIDGNTVETSIENAHFMENSQYYLASLNFLSKKFTGLNSALRGE